MLYDFNKGPGASWFVPICGDDFFCERDSIIVLVDSVTYTEINGFQLRTQHVSLDMPYAAPGASSKGTIYEGIGNAPLMYFFFGVCGLTIDFFVHKLNCYESPTHGIFNFIGGQPCGIYTAADEARPEVEKLLLHPNPAWESLHIQFPRMGAGQLAMYDARGRLLKTQPFDNVPETWALDVSALPTGMYLLQYRSEGRVMAVERFVKQ